MTSSQRHRISTPRPFLHNSKLSVLREIIQQGVPQLLGDQPNHRKTATIANTITAKQPQIANSITTKQPQIGCLNSRNHSLKHRWLDSEGLVSETEWLEHQLSRFITNANPNPTPGSAQEITTLQPAVRAQAQTYIPSHGTKRSTK